jgi:adenylosuccinate lyase
MYVWRKRKGKSGMMQEPMALRVPDPGVRALFTEASRWQSWLDVEAALADAEAALGVIPAEAAVEIRRKRPPPARSAASSTS